MKDMHRVDNRGHPVTGGQEGAEMGKEGREQNHRWTGTQSRAAVHELEKAGHEGHRTTNTGPRGAERRMQRVYADGQVGGSGGQDGFR